MERKHKYRTQCKLSWQMMWIIALSLVFNSLWPDGSNSVPFLIYLGMILWSYRRGADYKCVHLVSNHKAIPFETNTPLVEIHQWVFHRGKEIFKLIGIISNSFLVSYSLCAIIWVQSVWEGAETGSVLWVFHWFFTEGEIFKWIIIMNNSFLVSYSLFVIIWVQSVTEGAETGSVQCIFQGFSQEGDLPANGLAYLANSFLKVAHPLCNNSG